METDASTKPPEDEWEVVKSGGTIKRYPIPGGWIYGVWSSEREWRLVSAFFVPTASR